MHPVSRRCRDAHRPDPAVGTLRVDGLVLGPDDVLGVSSIAVGVQCIAVGLIAAEAAGIARWCVDNVVGLSEGA